jgi:hypothetical protein
MAIIEGTTGNDSLVGISGNDTFIGSKGNDSIEGIGTGNTVDYNTKQSAVGITIKPRGVVSKGALGIDQLKDIQTIVGNEKFENTIDVSSVTNGFNVINLQAGDILVQDNTGNFVLDVKVLNFKNVKGTQGNDTIAGSTGNDNLAGGRGNDTIIGRQGNDTLTGGGGNDIIFGGSGDDVLNGTGDNGNGSSSRGVNEQDLLVGGSGADKFILGDSKGSYYLGDKNNGFAKIQDFSTSDNLVLGANQAYVTRKTTQGFGLFAKTASGLDLIADVIRDQINGAARQAFAGDASDSFTIEDVKNLKADFTLPAELSAVVGTPSVAKSARSLGVADTVVAADLNSFDPFAAEGFQEFTLASGQKLGNFIGA